MAEGLGAVAGVGSWVGTVSILQAVLFSTSVLGELFLGGGGKGSGAGGGEGGGVLSGVADSAILISGPAGEFVTILSSGSDSVSNAVIE